MPTNQEEYAFGSAQEEQLKPFLEQYFGKELEHTDKWDPFDFVGPNIKVELKSRRNTYSKYPTTIVGIYKINKIRECDGEHYFVFNFTDGIYFWRYNWDDMSRFKTIDIKRHDRNKAHKYLSIPIEQLQKMELQSEPEPEPSNPPTPDISSEEEEMVAIN